MSSIPIPPGVSREQVDEILHKIRLCERGEREATNGHYNHNTDTYEPGLSRIVDSTLRQLGLPVTDDPNIYRQCVRDERRKLVEIDPMESNDVETLKRIRTKYVTVEDIKPLVQRDFSNYDEFLGYMDLSMHEIIDSRKYLDQRINNIFHRLDEERRSKK